MVMDGHDLWDKALQTLGKGERERYEQLLAKGAGYESIVSDVLGATTEKKEECVRKRWKIKLRGKVIIMRDVLEKVAFWVTKFVAVGDSAIQYDPGHAALPWAAIRLILTATVTEVEVFGAILQGVESSSKIITRCIVMERLYLLSNFEASDRLRESLIELYASILAFLGKALRYYSQNTAARITKSLAISIKDIDLWAKPIEEKQTEVDRLIALAESDRAKQMGHDVTLLKAGNVSQAEKLDKTYSALQRLSEELKRPINRIDDQLSQIQDDLEKQKRRSILKAISNVNFVTQHKVANAKLLPNSGKWLFNKSHFREWRDESSSSVLWLHGIPGSGKTKLTSMVVSELKLTSHTAYFYCVRNPAEPERAECESIFLSLVRQLACASPSSTIMAPIVSKYEDALEDMADFDEITWTQDETIEMLVELCDLYPAVTFVIDALDEVNPINRLELLDGLLKILDESQSLIKIFISSRENVDIATPLKDIPNLRIGAKENTEDIAKFVNEQLKLANLLNGRLPTKLKEMIPKTLIEGAQGMFRWVDLQIQSLKPLKVAADIEARLGSLPQSLEESYSEILDQIEASGAYAFRLACFTFQWLLYARKPLAIADFALFASSQAPNNLVFTSWEVLDVCQNLIVSNDAGIFRFAHLSVREFLEKLAEGQITGRHNDSFSSEAGNAAVGAACISYLRSTMHAASMTVTDLLSVSQQITKNPNLRKYTANYWPIHVSQSGQFKSQPPLSIEVRDFLISKEDVAPTFKHWCNIVMDELSSDALPKIRQAVQQPPNPIWLAHAYDITEIKHVVLDDKSMRSKAFVYAAKTGEAEVMLSYLAHGLDIKDIGIEAMAEATTAAQGGAVEVLLDFHVPVDPAWLIRAAFSNHSKVLVAMVKKGLKNFTSEQLKRAFCIATANNDTESIRAFIQQGVGKDRFAVVRALRAATPAAAMHLIDTGFDIHGSYPLEERTALHWAAERGFAEIVVKLLEKQVQVTVKDTWGNTPLHYAAWKGQGVIARALIDHGADQNALNNHGQVPLQLAVMMHRHIVIGILSGTPSNSSVVNGQFEKPRDDAHLTTAEDIRSGQDPTKFDERASYPSQEKTIPPAKNKDEIPNIDEDLKSSVEVSIESVASFEDQHTQTTPHIDASSSDLEDLSEYSEGEQNNGNKQQGQNVLQPSLIDPLDCEDSSPDSGEPPNCLEEKQNDHDDQQAQIVPQLNLICPTDSED